MDLFIAFIARLFYIGIQELRHYDGDTNPADY